MSLECLIYRCSRQSEMYLYLRADVAADTLPEPLLKKLGQLSEVMSLRLSPERKLARVDVNAVMAQLRERGYFLQLPPDGNVQAHLHMGD
jgi:uncharacterized protein YcgL (UPF0745 family)